MADGESRADDGLPPSSAAAAAANGSATEHSEACGKQLCNQAEAAIDIERNKQACSVEEMLDKEEANGQEGEDEDEDEEGCNGTGNEELDADHLHSRLLSHLNSTDDEEDDQDFEDEDEEEETEEDEELQGSDDEGELNRTHRQRGVIRMVDDDPDQNDGDPDEFFSSAREFELAKDCDDDDIDPNDTSFLPGTHVRVSSIDNVKQAMGDHWIDNLRACCGRVGIVIRHQGTSLIFIKFGMQGRKGGPLDYWGLHSMCVTLPKSVLSLVFTKRPSLSKAYGTPNGHYRRRSHTSTPTSSTHKTPPCGVLAGTVTSPLDPPVLVPTPHTPGPRKETAPDKVSNKTSPAESCTEALLSATTPASPI